MYHKGDVAIDFWSYYTVFFCLLLLLVYFWWCMADLRRLQGGSWTGTKGSGLVMPVVAWQVHFYMLFSVLENMGSLCSKQRHNPADSEENAQVESLWFIIFLISFVIKVKLHKLENFFSFKGRILYRIENLHFTLILFWTKSTNFFQTAEIERRIELETKAEKHIQKLLLLGI